MRVPINMIFQPQALCHLRYNKDPELLGKALCDSVYFHHFTMILFE